MKKIPLIAAFLCLLLGEASAQLIAEVRTSLGNFSITLDYNSARRTVSHFVRLAQGTQPWLDGQTGEVRYGTPFYNNLKFFKKIDEVAPVRRYIQAGARSNAEYDSSGAYSGTGYVLRDEMRQNIFGNILIPHNAYVVSMANVGPHSASSQFLITLVADASLNGKNSAFGVVNQQFYEYDEDGRPISVSSGWAVVAAIHASTLPVTINSVAIRRLDQVARDFNENEYVDELPFMGKLPITSVSHNATEVALSYSPLQSTEVKMFYSFDLFEWNHFRASTVYLPAGQTSNPPITALHGGAGDLFFRLAGLVYTKPAALASEVDLYGKTITVGLGTVDAIRFAFDPYGAEHAFYRYRDGAVARLTFDYVCRGPFYGDLTVTSPELEPRTYRLFFGGTDLNQSTDELMKAWIIEDGQWTIDSHFTMTE